MGVEHEEVELFHALLVVDGADQHAAGVDAHMVEAGCLGLFWTPS